MLCGDTEQAGGFEVIIKLKGDKIINTGAEIVL